MSLGTIETTVANALKNLSGDDIALLEGQAERLAGLTIERATSFYLLSQTENPSEDAAWHRDDAIGKFKHFLRKDRKWEGAVDVAWPFIEPEATIVVDLAIKNLPAAPAPTDPTLV